LWATPSGSRSRHRSSSSWRRRRAQASGPAGASRSGCCSAARAIRYRLEHAGLDPLEIFIVPIARNGEHTSYEAIFT
jgi:hypothetical protein